MRAIRILGEAESPKVTLAHDFQTPKPQNTQVLIAVHAAGITGDELQWPELYSKASRIPGHEVSGVVAVTGPAYVGPLRIGQEVFALVGLNLGQGQADFVICEADQVALKPTNISHAEAAAMPIPLLTAWEAIQNFAKIASGMTVLVAGASGAVGRSSVQLIKLLSGARVVALASASYHQSLEQLGADSVIDYHANNWQEKVTDIDVVLDTVGGDLLKSLWGRINENGTIVTVADPAPAWAFGKETAEEALAYPNIKYHYFIVSPNGQRLGDAAALIRSGGLSALPIRSFDFEAGVEAWQCAHQKRRGYKVVLEFSRTNGGS